MNEVDAVPDQKEPPQRPGTPSPLRPHTRELIERALCVSRVKYPGNRMMLAAAMGEMAELAGAMQSPGHEARVEYEAADVIAVLIRIIEEGDASFARRESPANQIHSRIAFKPAPGSFDEGTNKR
jgi:hypothetical protein